jgi:hypothetical protein
VLPPPAARADDAGVEPVAHRQTSSHHDGLRALVELASGDVAGRPERFVLPDGPRHAAALAGSRDARERPGGPADGLLAPVALVVLVACTCAVATLAAGPAVGVWAALFVATSSATARALVRALAGTGTGAGARSHCVALSREDSKRIAHRAAGASAALLRADGGDPDAAFSGYHEALLSLARYELAAAQAVAADRDLARLLPDDPLRSVAGQLAQDKAARAVAHRTAARAAADRLQADLRSRERVRRPPAAA